jgi:hypothetical protein
MADFDLKSIMTQLSNLEFNETTYKAETVAPDTNFEPVYDPVVDHPRYYWMAQLCHILSKKFDLSYAAIGRILNEPEANVRRWIKKVAHDFNSFSEIQEAFLYEDRW